MISQQLNLPVNHSLSPSSPLSLSNAVLKLPIACYLNSSTVFCPYMNSRNVLQRSLNTPMTVAICVCQSIPQPRRSFLLALWQRQIMMASDSQMSFSPSIKQGRLAAGFFFKCYGLMFENHQLAVQGVKMVWVQGMWRYSSTNRTFSARPLMFQYPNVTLSVILFLYTSIQSERYFITFSQFIKMIFYTIYIKNLQFEKSCINEIEQFVQIIKGKKVSKMKRQKSHTRIHQVIMDLRQKSRQQQKPTPTTKCPQQFDRPTTPSSNRHSPSSDILSLNQTQSIILPDNYCYHPTSQNLYFTSYMGSHELIAPQKHQSSGLKRVTKTARPVSRRKVTSKEKAQSTKTTQKPQQEQSIIGNTKKSSTFELLMVLGQQHFIIDGNQNHTDDTQSKQFKTLKAFWSLQHSFVSLFPIQYTECINYDHPNIIPIYGELTLSDRRFVVSNQYKNSSLRDLISEFGPFEESLCKRYLYQIVCGIEEMHSRKTTHNRLFSKNILYNKKGQIFINVVKSTSRPLTQKQKHQNLFQYSPETLLTKSKSNSLKNDIWSIGLIFLDMLFDFSSTDLKSIPLHPYNKAQKLSQIDSIIVDNLKQLYPKSFEDKNQQQQSQRINQISSNLSAECKDAIRQCLLLNKDERIDIKMLKSHKFFG